MTYDEQKAIDIIKTHNLSEKTLRVWKNRGAIPDKYSNPYYKAKKPPSEKDKIWVNRCVEVLKLPELNIKTFTDLAGVEYYSFHDSIKGKAQVGIENWIKIRKELNSFRVQIKKHLKPYEGKDTFNEREKKAMDTFINDERLVKRVFFDNNEYYSRWYFRERSPQKRVQTHYDYEVGYARDQLLKLGLKMSI